MTKVVRCLTIAGSDCSGGAGIQADLKTFCALKAYGMTVITSLTAQNTQGVFEVVDLPEDFVYRQIKVVAEDIGIDSAKTGMLSSAGIIQSVVKAVRDFRIEKIVVDPVMFSKSGHRLLKEEAIDIMVKELIPLSTVITPNKSEAEKIVGIEIKTEKDMKECARYISSLGAKCVVLKGGHVYMSEQVVTDVVYYNGEFLKLTYPRVNTKNTHGTGCTFSAAICVYLARGEDVLEAVRAARAFLQMALESSLNIGKGFGPLNHNIV